MDKSIRSPKILPKCFRLNNLEILSEPQLLKYCLRYNKLAKNLSIDHYHLYQKDFFPTLKKLRPLAKTCNKVQISVTSMGKNIQSCFKKTTNELKCFRAAKKFYLNCSTVFVTPEDEIHAIFFQLKNLKDLKDIHLNFLNSFLTTKGLDLIYKFHAIPRLESLTLKVPSAKCIQKTSQTPLKRIYGKFGGLKNFKRKLKGFELTLYEDEGSINESIIKNPAKAKEGKGYTNVLRYLDNVEHLKLNIGNGVLPKISADLISCLMNLKKLRSLALRLNNNEILDPDHIQKILSLFQFLDLHRLELKLSTFELITESFSKALEKLKNLEVLKLDISQQVVNSDNFELFTKALSNMKRLQKLKIKCDFRSSKLTIPFYLPIMTAIRFRPENIKSLQLYYPKGILSAAEIENFVQILSKMKNLTSFGISAKKLSVVESDDIILTRFFGCLVQLSCLSKLRLDFPLPSNMKRVIDVSLSSLAALTNLEKLVIHCPYSSQEAEQIGNYYNKLCLNHSIKRVRIDLPYFDEVKGLLKPNARKLITKSVYWDLTYRIIYDLYF